MAGNVVIAISSENVWIQAADGTRRVAKAGDLVQESDTLIVANGQEVILQGPDELPIYVEPGQFSFAELQNQFDQAVGQTGEDEIAALQQSILDGVDPTQTFEAAAAGEEAPVEASDGGSSVSTIARSAEEVVAQGGFDTGAASASAERTALADGAENLAPVITAASPDLITDEDVNLLITTEQLTSNVTDPDGDVLSVQSLQLSNPDAGTLVDNGDGTWTLVLTENWNGAVSLSYTVVDAVGNTVENSANVNVTPVNDAPIISVDDAALSAVEDGVSVSGNASFTDVDTNDTHTYSVSNLPAEQGSVSIDPVTGEYTYSPAGAFQSLAVGETATVSFDVTVTDREGATDTETVTVTITGTNDAPELSVGNLTASEDGPSVTGNASFTDVDTSDTHSYSVSSLPAEQGSVSIDPATGEYTYNPGSGFQSLAAGETTTVSFDITVTDNHGATDTETVTVTITGTNDAPELSVGNLTASEDSLSVTGNASFTDVDTNDTHTYSVSGLPAGQGSVSIDSATGQYTYSPGDAFQSLAAGESTIVGFNVTVTDNNGASDTETVFVTIIGTNDGPVAVNDVATTSEDTPINNINVLGNDSDVDGDALTVTEANAANGSVTINLDGTLNYTPTNNFNGTDTITYTISDGNGGTSTATVSVNVGAVDDAPKLTVDNAVVTLSESATAGVIVGADADATDADGDKLTFSLVGDVPTNSNGEPLFSINADTGEVSLTAAGQAELDYDTAPDSYSIAVQASDGTHVSNTETITINLSNENDNPPVLTVDNAEVTLSESATAGAITGADADATDADGDTPTFSLVGNVPTNANGEALFSIDTNTGQISLTVAGEAELDFDSTPTSYELSVQATDGKNVSNVEKITINLSNENDNPPVLTVDNAVVTLSESATAGVIVGADADATDADGDKLTFSLVGDVPTNSNGEALFSINADTGEVSLTAAGQAELDYDTAPNSYSIAVQASDGTHVSNTETITINLSNENEAPTSDSFTINSNEREVSLDFATDTGHSHSQPDGNNISGSEVHDQDGDTIAIQLDSLPDAAVGTLWWDSNSDGSYDTQVTQEMLDAEGGFKANTDSLQYQLNDGLPSHISAGGQLDSNNQLSDWGIVNAGDSSGTSIYAGGATIKVTGSGGLYQNTYSASDDGGGIGVGKGGELDNSGESISVEFGAPNAVISTVSLSLTGMGSWYEQGDKHESQATVKVYDTEGNLIDPALLTFTTVNAGSGSTSSVSGGSSSDGDITVSDNTFFINNNDSKPANANGSDYLTQNVSISVSDSSISIGKVEIGHHNVKGGAGSFEVLNVGADISYTDSFNYHPIDSEGNSGEQSTVTIHSSPDNSAPEAQADQFRTDEDRAVDIDLLANDSDVDGDDLHISEINGQAIIAGQASQVDVGNGIVNIDADGKVTFTPDDDFSGDASFQYKVEDSNGSSSAEATATVSVTATVDEPTMKATPESVSPVAGQAVMVDASISSPDGSESIVDVGVSALPKGLEAKQVDGKWQFTTDGDGEYKTELVGKVVEDNGAFVEAVREVTVTTVTTQEQKVNTTYGNETEGVYKLSADSTGLDIKLNFTSEEGGYQNSFGVYFADKDGKPISGYLVETVVDKNDLGEKTLHVDGKNIPDGAVSLGFFLVSDGGDKNAGNAAYEDGALVNFNEVSGIISGFGYNAEVGGQLVEVADMYLGGREPIVFSNPSLNLDGEDHEMQSGSGHAWEDLVGHSVHSISSDIGVEYTLTETFEHTTTNVEVGETQLRYHGTDSDDLLIGSDGDDLLIGGLGDDQLEGGAGADTFKWQAGDADGSTDKVVDFNPDQGDVLDISELLTDLKEGDAISDYLNASISDDGQDMVIDVDANRDGSADLTINLEGYAQTHSITSDGVGDTTSVSDELNRLLDNNGQDPNII